MIIILLLAHKGYLTSHKVYIYNNNIFTKFKNQLFISILKEWIFSTNIYT